MIVTHALQSVRTATTVRVRSGKQSVTDGPFAETKEQLSGFFLIDARDLNEAIQVASRWPSARLGSIKVRPIEEELRQDSRWARLLDLFEGRRQLIVYHFMFDPKWDKGCPGCTGLVDALGDLSMLQARDTTFVLVSRAPLAKLDSYKAQKGWNLPWVSSYGSPFNYDFHVTLDESVAPLGYNYRDKAELEQRTHETYFTSGESHGLSVFFRVNDDIFHSYSTYARGCEGLTDAYSLLDRTPYGRQEDFEDSPPGWPQKPTYG